MVDVLWYRGERLQGDTYIDCEWCEQSVTKSHRYVALLEIFFCCDECISAWIRDQDRAEDRCRWCCRPVNRDFGDAIFFDDELRFCGWDCANEYIEEVTG